jgi:16S rRNA G966 N2-methylase RsmD
MIQEKYSDVEKREISQKIKPILLEDIQEEYHKLRNIGPNAANESPRSRLGNDIVDYFTFQERLNTRGKYGLSYYDFLANMKSLDPENPLKQKKFIQTMLKYYQDVKNKNQTKNEYKVYKEVYNICISAINIFRPLMAMEVYTRFKPKCVLDFTCGWGGRLISACVLDVPHYIGIDSNQHLAKPYDSFTKFLKEQGTKTDIQLFFEDALTFDYSTLKYDMVFTSPPYYDLEIYSCQPEIKDGEKNQDKNDEKKEKEKKEKKEKIKKNSFKNAMNENFYKPLFQKTYEHLQPGGVYALNVNQEIYESVCVPLWGEANEKIPLKKSKRQNNYSEYIYVFLKKYSIEKKI